MGLGETQKQYQPMYVDEDEGAVLMPLLCCPFCGSEPDFPLVDDVYGTCYDAGCNDCGVATISIQIIDCFDYGESPNREDVHNSWDDENVKYGDKFIEVARDEAIKRWNTRAT